MLKSIIQLPDGSQISSGPLEATAICSITVTNSVNSGSELTLGSAYAGMLEAVILLERGEHPFEEGMEVTLLQQDETGNIHQIGLFTLERPVMTGPNRICITAYDRVSWLDKDLTQWLKGLTGWPYTLQNFAKMVCRQCGLTLADGELPNGSFPVEAFSAEEINGRQLIQLVGQVAGRFCRATATGELEFAWYTPTDILLTTTGKRFYYQGSLSYADYRTEPIKKVQLRQNSDDVGTVYPNPEGSVNTYILQGNPILAAVSADSNLAVAQALYEQLGQVSYTPCKVTVPAGEDIRPGDIITIERPKGEALCMYVMSRTRSGQRDTLECTGSARCSSTIAVNDRRWQALDSKVLHVRSDVDGLLVENRDTAGKVAKLTVNVDSLTGEISQQQKQADAMDSRLTQVQQTAQDLSVTVQSVLEDGVSRVETAMGYTFDDQGLSIRKSGQEMENRLDHTGMYVERSGEVILQANNQGVVATDVQVRNYLILGGHSRLEDYGGRTACFWI